MAHNMNPSAHGGKRSLKSAKFVKVEKSFVTVDGTTTRQEFSYDWCSGT